MMSQIKGLYLPASSTSTLRSAFLRSALSQLLSALSLMGLRLLLNQQSQTIILQFVNRMHEHTETEKIYIDPERLLKLKKERKPFKQVASIFEPPPQKTQQTNTAVTANRHSSINQRNKENQLLRSEVLINSRHPNVDFILSLIGEIKPEQVIWLQEGDCINMRTDQRWVLLEGQVRVTGVGGRMFSLKEGSILFINVQTRWKIKEVICLKGTRVMKISQQVFQRVRNYIFLKNAQKIKYLKYCPFFIWTDQLSEDLAACMYMKVYEKGEQIYQRGDSAHKIMFVKEGVVLLQRMLPLANQVLREYQNHYQRSEISQSESTLVVKKGMVFGIDGILLKDSFEQPLNKQLNPQHYDKRGKQQMRVYSARTLGRTEVYVLQKQVLEGLFDVNDLMSASNFPRELTKGDLQKICSDYAEMVVRHRSLPKIMQSIASKELTLDNKIQSSKQGLLQKKTKVRQVRQQQELTKRHSIAKIISDCKHYRMADINNSVVLQHHFNQKLGLDRQQDDGLAFPALSSHLKKRRTPKENKRGEQAEKYIMQWLRGSEHRESREEVGKVSVSKKQGKLSLINIRSYRSIIPSIS